MARKLVLEQEQEDGKEFPTQREATNLPLKTKAKPQLKITGNNSPFGTLNFTRSHDPVMNMAYTVVGRAIVFKWKQLVLMLKGRASLATS